MKSKIITITVLSVLFILVGCQNESQPTQGTSDLGTQSLDKKPPKNPKPELIIFTGDLAGNQEVVGCCPNAGPSPEYTLTLSGPLPAGTYPGEIFMNFTGNQSPGDYMVQFSTGTMYLEIRGGVAHNDRRNKILTVTFVDVPCEVWIDGALSDTVPVNFVLTRAQL